MQKILCSAVICLVSATAMAGTNLEFKRSLTMSADRINAVEFDVGAGSLEIVGTTSSEMTINATITSDEYRDMSDLQEDFEKYMQFGLTRESGYAMVHAKNKDGFKWGSAKNIAIHLEVEIPKHLDLVIDDGSGAIVVENINGELKIDDGSGPIKLINIGSDVHIDDGSGPIMVADVDGDLDIDDGSGSIELKNISGTVTIEDGSGAITAKDIGGDFSVDDGSGDIVVKNLRGQFKLIDDGSGSVRVNGQRWGKK